MIVNVQETIDLFKDKKIGVLSGGVSPEREVSLNSGRNIYECLVDNGYNAIFLDLQREEQLQSLIIDNEINVIFNALHGYFGEDGRVQNLLDQLKIPFTGCGMEASSLGMNKLWTKLIAKSLNIPVANYEILKMNSEIDKTKLSARIPFIMKPVIGGSSVETYLVKNIGDLNKLPKKITQDFLLEDYIRGIEVTAGVLSSQGQILNLPILQLDSQNDFYDYEAKYTGGKTHFIVPALLSQAVENSIKSHAYLMHQTLNCKGATRCDFIIRNDIPYFLEINTSPGMTPLSDIPAEAKSIGIELIKLCEIILKTAL